MKATFRFFTLLTILAASLILFANRAHAATLNVVVGTDAIDTNGQCQLSEAIQNINDQDTIHDDCTPTGAYGTDDTITLPAGTITLSGDLAELSESIIIQGQGESLSIIDGNNKQYSGIKLGLQSVPPFIENFEFRDASIIAAKNYGIFGYGIVSFALSNASISDGDSGVIVVAQNVQVADTQIDNNTGTDNNLGDVGETAGMYVQLSYTGEGPMPSFAAENSSMSNNTTTSSADMSPAGLLVGINCSISNGCDGDATTVDISSVEVDNNVSVVSDEASFSGITLMAVFEQSYANSPPTQLRINSTSVSENSAESPTGAALSGLSLYPLSITENSWLRNLTVHANSAITESNQVPSIAGAFGQLLASSMLEVSNITFTENQSQFPQDSYFPVSGLVFGRLDPDTGNVTTGIELSNSILAANTKNDEIYNCENSIDIGSGPSTVTPVSLGGNISDDASCASSFTQPTDQNNVDPADLKLGTLGDYGGSVPTIPLGQGSIAIDSGVTVAGLTTDARGVTRPQCAAYDSGAYEYNGTCPAPQQLTYPDPEKGSTVSLVLPSDVASPSVSAVDPDTIPKDGENQFLAGLTSFQFTTTPGATKTVTLYYDLPGSPSSYTARKYKTNSQAFIDVPGATITREDYNGKSMLKLTYAITDGGILDQDGVANGTVIDPVGLATTASLASTGDNLWLYALGIIVLLGSGVWMQGRAEQR
jgi:hypothetical protein